MQSSAFLCGKKLVAADEWSLNMTVEMHIEHSFLRSTVPLNSWRPYQRTVPIHVEWRPAVTTTKSWLASMASAKLRFTWMKLQLEEGNSFKHLRATLFKDSNLAADISIRIATTAMTRLNMIRGSSTIKSATYYRLFKSLVSCCMDARRGFCLLIGRGGHIVFENKCLGGCSGSRTGRSAKTNDVARSTVESLKEHQESVLATVAGHELVWLDLATRQDIQVCLEGVELWEGGESQSRWTEEERDGKRGLVVQRSPPLDRWDVSCLSSCYLTLSPPKNLKKTFAYFF